MPEVSHRKRPRGSATLRLACATALGLSLASAATAQDNTKHLTLNGIMSATGAPGGSAFVSLAGTPKAASTSRTDGSFAFGFGLGNAEEKVGVQITANITSLTADSGGFGFGDSGYLTLKFSKRLGTEPLYLGLQIDRIAPWGAAVGRTVTTEVDGDEEGPIEITETVPYDISGKLALSWFSTFDMRGESYPLMLTVGVGNKVRNNELDPGVFAGVGVGLTRNVAASLAWSGDYLDLGLGMKMADNLHLTATLNDAFDMKDRQHLTLSVSYSFNMFGG